MVQIAGGLITKADMQGYGARMTVPLSTSLSNGGYTMYSTPPPTSGAILNFILKVLDGKSVSFTEYGVKKNIFKGSVTPESPIIFHEVLFGQQDHFSSMATCK